MTIREVLALLITMLALTLLALVAALLTGCASPPKRKVTRVMEADFWVILPDGKRIDKSYKGIHEVEE